MSGLSKVTGGLAIPHREIFGKGMLRRIFRSMRPFQRVSTASPRSMLAYSLLYTSLRARAMPSSSAGTPRLALIALPTGFDASRIARTNPGGVRERGLHVVRCLTRILHGRSSCSEADSERAQPCVPRHGTRVTSTAPLPQHPPFARATPRRELVQDARHDPTGVR